ncbi:MAG: Holliday junction resolvase RuvX [Bacteroidales bacterium]
MKIANFAPVMGRILALDIGQKRIGVAVSDPLRMIATPLGTWHVKDIWQFLQTYIPENNVDLLVAGLPLQMDNSFSDSIRFVTPFVNRLKKLFPHIGVHMVDERFTSKMATAAIRESGVNKKTRQDKALVDTISATIILQSYMSRESRVESRELRVES